MKVIRKDSVIKFDMRTGIIQRLHNLSMFLLEGKSSEEVDAVKKAIADQKLTEPWMYHVETVVGLIQQIEQAAEEQGCITEVPDEQIMPETAE